MRTDRRTDKTKLIVAFFTVLRALLIYGFTFQKTAIFEASAGRAWDVSLGF